MGRIARRMRRAALLLAAQQALEQREPEPRSQYRHRAARGGRPRLGQGFAAILRRLSAGTISQRQAARELGVSARTVKRYLVARLQS
jgi:FixJ family two-component response regulator